MRFWEFLKDELQVQHGYIWAVVFHKQSGNAVSIVALDIAHFHIEICVIFAH